MSLHVPVALKYRQFRLLWLGMLVSVAGSQMQTWALFWHIRELTEHPIALGGVGLVRILPIIVFSLVGGAVADVANRRRVLFITQSAMALTALGLAWLTFQDSIALMADLSPDRAPGCSDGVQRPFPTSIGTQPGARQGPV